MFHLSSLRSLILLIGCGIFGLTYAGRVFYTGSDPQPALLVSQAILEHHTVRLDAYEHAPDSPLNHYTVVQRNGHDYYNYPIGTPIFSLPFVRAANLAGKDMSVLQDNYRVQKLIAGLLCALAFFLLYSIGRHFLSAAHSAVIAGVSVLGSSLTSTMGTALWNTDFAVFFILLSLLLIVRHDRGQASAATPYSLGLFLFAAYLCRPAASVFILVTLAYSFARDRNFFLKVVATSSILLVGYLIFSRVEYGQWIEEYYSASRLGPRHGRLALYGLFLSPSRGLLVYSPFFAPVLAGLLWYFDALKRNALVWFCLIWSGLHLLIVARNSGWWGGHSFGPRLLTEAVPALVLLTVILWQALSQNASRHTRRVFQVSYLALGAAGIWINSVQGLYNYSTARWNSSPDIDRNSAYLFDWKYPQFLATAESVHARMLEHILRQAERGSLNLEPYALGDTLAYTDRNSRIFVGWSDPEPGRRWSEITSPKIFFEPGPMVRLDEEEEIALEIVSGSWGTQPVTLYLNGAQIGEVTLQGPPAAYSLAFDGALLKPGDLNQIEFIIPGAAFPGNGDLRRLGMSFVGLRITP